MVKIYTLTDPITNQIRYVGKTRNKLNHRLGTHCSPIELQRTKTHKRNWIKFLKERNLRPVIEIIDIVPEQEWEFWEQYWICQIKAWGYKLTNSTLGGGGTSPLKRKGHTQETKDKIAKANSHPKTEEWIFNASQARQVKVLQLDLNNNLIKEWPSASRAAESLGDINKKKNISSCCYNQYGRKSAYGFKWCFKNTELEDKELLG